MIQEMKRSNIRGAIAVLLFALDWEWLSRLYFTLPCCASVDLEIEGDEVLSIRVTSYPSEDYDASTD
jgi:hypothetical protein